MARELEAPGLSCLQTSVLPTFLPRTQILACRTGSNGRAGLCETKAGMEGGLWHEGQQWLTLHRACPALNTGKASLCDEEKKPFKRCCSPQSHPGLCRGSVCSAGERVPHPPGDSPLHLLFAHGLPELRTAASCAITPMVLVNKYQSVQEMESCCP